MSKKAHFSARGGRQSGGTVFGAIAGLLLGLVVAAAVALYVTTSPIPFVARASRGPDPSLPDPGFAPDPNRSLYGRDAPGGLAPSGPITTSPAPVPQVAKRDELGDLLASLSSGKPGVAPQAPPAAAPSRAEPAPAAPAAPPAAAPAGRYLLQVGAFRVLEDAEALKARLAFLGFDVRLQQA